MITILYLGLLFWLFVYARSHFDELGARIDVLERHSERDIPLSGHNVGESAQKESISSGTVVPSTPPPPPQREEVVLEQSPVSHRAVAQETGEETGARWLGRLGAFAVFLGVAYFLKYAFDNGLISETARVILGVIFGVVLIGIGEKLRATYLNYSDLLFASGIGVLYLSIYAAFGFYHLIPSSSAFVLMALVTLFGMVLALAGASAGLAILSIIGGFLTPILLSTGENHLVTLSLYMAILDLGVFGVAWFKKWNLLNFISFFGTLLLFSGWMGKYYTEPQFGLTFMFASIFFFIFLATSVLHHLLRKEKTTTGDLVLLVLNAVMYFSIGTRVMTGHLEDFLGFFALTLALIYLGVAYASYESDHTDHALNLFLPGMATVFLTIAIPLQLSGYWVSLSWLIESVVLVGLGAYLRERTVQIFGWIVLALGLIGTIGDVEQIQHTGVPHAFFNTGFFLMVASVLVLFVIAWIYRRFVEGVPAEETRIPFLTTLVLGIAGSAIAISHESGLVIHALSLTPWLVVPVPLLFVGLLYRSRVIEMIGWVAASFSITALPSYIREIHFVLDPNMAPLPFFNLGVFFMLLAVLLPIMFIFLYRREGVGVQNLSSVIGALLIVANVLLITSVTSEIGYFFERKIDTINMQMNKENSAYWGGASVLYDDTSVDPGSLLRQEEMKNLSSLREITVSIFWTLYAILLIAIGFMKRVRVIRLFGLIFFFATAARVFLQIFRSADELGRIVTLIFVGIIALSASFLYVKFKDRIIYE